MKTEIADIYIVVIWIVSFSWNLLTTEFGLVGLLTATIYVIVPKWTKNRNIQINCKCKNAYAWLPPRRAVPRAGPPTSGDLEYTQGLRRPLFSLY